MNQYASIGGLLGLGTYPLGVQVGCPIASLWALGLGLVESGGGGGGGVLGLFGGGRGGAGLLGREPRREGREIALRSEAPRLGKDLELRSLAAVLSSSSVRRSRRRSSERERLW